MLTSPEVTHFFGGDVEVARSKLPFAMELYRQLRANREASAVDIEVDGFHKMFSWGRIKCRLVHGQATLHIYAHPRTEPIEKPDKPSKKGKKKEVVRTIKSRTFLKIFCHFDRMTNPLYEVQGHDSNLRHEVVSAVACAKIDMDTLDVVQIVSVNTDLLARPQWGLGLSIWDIDPANYESDKYNWRKATDLPAAYDALFAFSPSIPEPPPVYGAERTVERLSIPLVPKVDPNNLSRWDPATGYSLMGNAVFDLTDNYFVLPTAYRNDTCNTTKNTAHALLSLSVFEQTQCTNQWQWYRWTSYQIGQLYNPYQSPGPITPDFPILGEHEYFIQPNDYTLPIVRRVWGYKHPIGGMVFNGAISWHYDLLAQNNYHLSSLPNLWPIILGVEPDETFYFVKSSISGYWDPLYPIKNFLFAGFSYFTTEIIANVVEVLEPPPQDGYQSRIVGCYYFVTGYCGPQPTARPSDIPENTTLVDRIKEVVTAAVTTSGGTVGNLNNLDSRIATNPDAEFWLTRGITNFDYRSRRGAMLLPPATCVVTGGYLCMEKMICEDTIITEERHGT